MKQTYKNVAILGAAVISITGGALLPNVTSEYTTESIFKMYAENSNTYNETAIFKEIENNEGIVIDEKEAINPMYVFTDTDEIKYASSSVPLQLEPSDTGESYTISEAGEELHINGYNDMGYAKIVYDEKELFVKEENLTEDATEVIKPCDVQKYALDTSAVYDSAALEQATENIEKGELVNVVGENDAGIAMIEFEDTTGYVPSNVLVNQMPQSAYMETGTDGVTDYYANNMVDGVLSVVPDSEKTEENAIKLAKLIHCEAGGQTEEGKLAVATVVVNRVFDQRLGTTIDEVINRKGQFSPVSSGTYANASYSEEDYAAATKVLFEGYRSFPAYVLYFQSHRDGYFAGHKTYMVCYDANKRSPQYFSYKTSDMQSYMVL